MSAAELSIQPLATERLTLLPLTLELRQAYRTGYEESVVSTVVSNGFDKIVCISAEPHRRSYAIFVTSQFTPPPAKAPLPSQEQKKCVGVVSLVGELVPTGLMRGDDVGPRQYHWNFDIHIHKRFRRNGYAREAGKAAIKSLSESSLEVILANKDRDMHTEPGSGRDVHIQALVPPNDTAAKMLTGQLGLKEVGHVYSSLGPVKIIKSKIIVQCSTNAQGIYEVNNVSDVLEKPPRPFDPYWRPGPLVAERVVLLPLTEQNKAAYDTVASVATGGTLFGLLGGTPKTLEPHADLLSDKNPDCRSYGVFRLANLAGLPSDMQATKAQQKTCIGIVVLMGHLAPEPSPGSGKLRRLEWHLNVTIIPSARKQGYGKESAAAAIKGLVDEGAGVFEESDIDAYNKRRLPEFGVKGFQGLGEEVVITGQYDKSNSAAERLLKTLGFQQPKKDEATIGGSSSAGARFMVKPVGTIQGGDRWFWAHVVQETSRWRRRA